MTEALDSGSTKPRRLNFQSSSRVRIDPDKARRQGEVASLAFLYLGGREGAIAFLNNHDVDLDGRPIDIAMASQEGCWSVRNAILNLAASPLWNNSGERSQNHRLHRQQDAQIPHLIDWG